MQTYYSNAQKGPYNYTEGEGIGVSINKTVIILYYTKLLT